MAEFYVDRTRVTHACCWDTAIVNKAQELICECNEAHAPALLEALLETEKISRTMFVARLERMGEQKDFWLTTSAVLALLSDCDMLAQGQVR